MTFDPYYRWLGIPVNDQPPNHYRLLGIERFESDREVISTAADRQMVHVRSFQTGPHAAESQRLLNEIARAAGCLLNVKRKAEYDAQLRKGTVSGQTILPPTVNPTAPQQQFGEFAIRQQLGTSSTGPMYQAQHRPTGRIVALKLLAPEATQSPELLERFRRKARILSSLSHPNLVAAHASGEWNGTHYLVMEFVDGTDMQSLCKQYGMLPIPHVTNYTQQAAAGLGYAHGMRVVHRNVKLSNLMLDRQGVVKVIGLGFARADWGGAGSREITQVGQAIGTCEYMAPEQALDPRSADHRADIYSLGCVLYKMLTGRAVYPEKSPLQVVQAHCQAPIPSLCQVRPDVPAALDRVFQKMLAKTPDQRFQSMSDVIAAL